MVLGITPGEVRPEPQKQMRRDGVESTSKHNATKNQVSEPKSSVTIGVVWNWLSHSSYPSINQYMSASLKQH